MDWIKVKTNHILYEYNDLRDSEFRAWVKIMALAAQLEHEPTREQMLKIVNYQTLDSLSSKLHEHSIDLSYILHKVLMDVSYVLHKREASKINTQRFRERNKPVSDYVSITSSHREEKRTEEKNKPPISPKGESFTSDFLSFWKAYPKKTGKKAAWKAWKAANDKPDMGKIINAINEQKKTDQWKRGFIKNPQTWINQGCWDDDPDSMKGGDNGGNRPGDFQGKRSFNADARSGNGAGGSGVPKKYNPEPRPDLSPEEEQRGREALQKIISSI